MLLTGGNRADRPCPCGVGDRTSRLKSIKSFKTYSEDVFLKFFLYIPPQKIRSSINN